MTQNSDSEQCNFHAHIQIILDRLKSTCQHMKSEILSACDQLIDNLTKFFESDTIEVRENIGQLTELLNKLEETREIFFRYQHLGNLLLNNNNT